MARKYIVFFILILSLFVPSISRANSTIKPPTVSDINTGLKSTSEAFIIGYTNIDTSVSVYIDGSFEGISEIEETGKNKNTFYFYLENLLQTGEHKVFTVARDKFGMISAPSIELKFYFDFNELTNQKSSEESLEKQDIIVAPEINVTPHNDGKALISINDNLSGKVLIIIDGEQRAQIAPDQKEHVQGKTVNFLTSESFKPGEHFAEAVVLDKQGNELSRSNLVKFFIISSLLEKREKPVILKIPRITPVAAQELADDEVFVEGVENEGNIEASTASEEEFFEPSTNEIVDQLINSTSSEEEKVGLFDETNSRAGKLRLNIVLFLVFLIAIVGWIIWVNKEVIKDQEKEDAEDKADEVK